MDQLAKSPPFQGGHHASSNLVRSIRKPYRLGGLGRCSLKAKTGVRIPLGLLSFYECNFMWYMGLYLLAKKV